MGLNITRFNSNAIIPTVSHPGEDLGFDLYASSDSVVTPFSTAKIPTGISARFIYPGKRFGLLIRDRSSVALSGLFVVGGVIDAGYTGEIIILMRSFANVLIDVKAGQKIAQMIPMEVFTSTLIEEREDFTLFKRGVSGFGSTNKVKQEIV